MTLASATLLQSTDQLLLAKGEASTPYEVEDEDVHVLGETYAWPSSRTLTYLFYDFCLALEPINKQVFVWHGENNPAIFGERASSCLPASVAKRLFLSILVLFALSWLCLWAQVWMFFFPTHADLIKGATEWSKASPNRVGTGYNGIMVFSNVFL